MDIITIVFPILLLIVAFLYASVGHGGASGYLAIMSIIGISSSIMKPSALILNIFVAGIAFYQYYKSGYFKWKMFYPFILSSIPAAFLGAFITIDALWYKRILAVCLVLATLRILGVFNRNKNIIAKTPPLIPALIIGAGIGLISGMIGIGGGIILSPVIMLMGWGNMKETAATSALFILINSISGLTGHLSKGPDIPVDIFIWVAAAMLGGIAGAYWGSKKATLPALKYTLAFVLLFAAIKLVFV